MTLLMCQQTPTWAALITDTLVTDTRAGDNVPVLFTTKVWTYLHANTVMMVTGLCDLGDAFDDLLRRKMGIDGVEKVAELAAGALPELHANLLKWYAEVFPGETVGTVTVYLWGYASPSSMEMVRYAYRSPKSFEQERTVATEPMFFAKPFPQQGEWYVPETREEIIALAERIREENGDGTAEKTVAIGGDLHLTLIEPNRISSELIYRFPHYAESQRRMDGLLERSKGEPMKAFRAEKLAEENDTE